MLVTVPSDYLYELGAGDDLVTDAQVDYYRQQMEEAKHHARLEKLRQSSSGSDAVTPDQSPGDDDPRVTLIVED